MTHFMSRETAKELRRVLADRLVRQQLLTLRQHSWHTFRHTMQVIIICAWLALRLGLPEEQRRTLLRSAALHDLGKLKIRNEVLSKHGPLTDEEREEMDWHTLYSCELAEGCSSEELGIILTHHHSWYGEVTNKMDLLQQLLALADITDALLSSRPYKKACCPMNTSFTLLRVFQGSKTLKMHVISCLLREQIHFAPVPERAVPW